MKKIIFIAIIALSFISVSNIAKAQSAQVEYRYEESSNSEYTLCAEYWSGARYGTYLLKVKNPNDYSIYVTYRIKDSENMGSSNRSGAFTMRPNTCRNIVIDIKDEDDYDAGWVDIEAEKAD